MAYIVKIPKLGLTMTEGTINVWIKSEGEIVKKGDEIFEIATDKLINEIESEEDGVIRKILVEEGETKPILFPVAIIAKEDEDISNLLNEVSCNNIDEKESIKQEDSDLDVEEHVNNINNIEILASPLAKKIAKERDIDLSTVSGTGIRNMIVAKDLDNMKTLKASPLALKMMIEHGIDSNEIKTEGKIMEDDVLKYIQNKSYVTSLTDRPLQVIKEKATPMRKAISKNMSYSFTHSPRVTFNIDIDATELKNLRNNLKISLALKDLKLTYNHILIKVCSKALMEFKYMNSQFDGEEITIFPYANIGLAVGLENGLIVPNLKNTESKSLSQISKETEEMIFRAKSFKSTEEELSGGTFTITNLGNYGISSFTPIINQPEVAILGVNQLIDKPVALDGNIVIKPILSLSLTADHRLIDGVYAARFLGRIKELLENPLLLLV